MKDIQKSLEEIIQYIGGIGNIANVTHCMTRLRLVLKDESLEEKEKLEESLSPKEEEKLDSVELARNIQDDMER